MAQSCWCGHSTSDYIHGCAICSVLSRHMTGLTVGDIPRGDEIELMNKILAEGRGLTEEQRFSLLVKRFQENSELPRSFRTRRGPAIRWSEDDVITWQQFLSVYQQYGIHENQVDLPLPGGSTLSVLADGKFAIDNVALPGKLPLVDIGIWLTSTERAGAVNDWKRFLFAMSCSTRELLPEYERDWAEWYRFTSWHGLEPHVTDLLHRLSALDITHPYMKWMRLIQQDTQPEAQSRNGFIDADPALMQSEGGAASANWEWIIDKGDTVFQHLMERFITPKLVVMNDRLHLLGLVNGQPAPIPLMVDPQLWRLLISWTLQPPHSVGGTLLKRLFWCWNSPYSDWTLTSAQRKSTLFLRTAVEGLGEFSSLEPVVLNRNSYGLRVAGRSGLHYVIQPTADPRKFNVLAVPEEEFIDDALSMGISVCIDSNSNKNLPPGDIAASYLLALRNDLTSRAAIVTLDHLLSLVQAKGKVIMSKSDKERWWESVKDGYYCHDDEDEEDWEDEEEDDEFEFDPEYEVVDERPDAQALEDVRQIIQEQVVAIDENDEVGVRMRMALQQLFQRLEEQAEEAAE